LPFLIHVGSFGQSVGRLAGGKLDETPWRRYAIPASGSRCNVFEGDSPKVVRYVTAKTPEFQELMIAGDLRDADCRRIGTPQRGTRLVQAS